MSTLIKKKSSVILLLLAIFAAIFFGLVSFVLISLVGKHYVYLFGLPVAFFIGIIFIFNRELFLLLVILTRSSLDVAFSAIKIGSFGLGAVLNALVILVALLIFFEKPVKLDTNSMDMKRCWFLFLTLGFISLFYTSAFVPGLKAFLTYVSYAAMLALGISAVKTEKDFSKWIRVIVLSSLIPIIYGVISLISGGRGVRYSIQEGLRLQSTFPHPNTLAPYLVLIISVTFFVYKSKLQIVSSSIRRFIPIYFLLLVVMLLMTKTRSAWAVCYLFFFMYGLLLERKFLVLVIVAPFLALFIPDVQDRILDLARDTDYGANGYGRLNSYAWRLKIWHDSINWMSPIHYIGGYGLTSFVHHSMDFGMANAFEKQDFEINAHNVYVQVFFEVGILGLLSFLYLILTHYKAMFKLYSRDKLLIFTAISIFTQFLMQAYSDNLLDYLIFQWYMWFFIGLCLAYASKLGIRHDKSSNNSYLRKE